MPQPPLDPDLLRILVCPLTRSPLRQDGEALVAERPSGSGLRYPVRDGIPILLIEEAELPEGIASLDAFRERFASEIAPDPT
ncbi:MAG: Trm112 family protein [Planctomycetota bacterium]